VRLEQFIQGNDDVQQHVASEREKNALVAVSPLARKAIKQEILPQIEESVISVESAEDLCNSTKRSIEAAFSFKNQIYTRLIQYKSIDQSDSQFLDDLLMVMDEWLRGMKAQLDDGESKAEGDSEKQEVEVTVKVEQAPADETVTVKDPESGPKIEVDPSEIFDLADVRL
jgi:hypothetical protein